MALLSVKRRLDRLERLAQRKLGSVKYVVTSNDPQKDEQAIAAASAEAGPFGTVYAVKTGVPPRDVEYSDEDVGDDFDDD